MKFKISIGDWSSDGHGKCEYYIFEANHEVEVLQDGYKKSCLLTGLQFNHNENYTGIKFDWKNSDDYQICTEYEKCTASKIQYDTLKRFGLDLQNYSPNIIEDDDEDKYVWLCDPDLFAIMILDFIKISIIDLEYTEASFKKSELKNIPSLNGWWNDKLNVQFGYGIFE